MALLVLEQRKEKAYQLYFAYYKTLPVMKLIEYISKEMKENPSNIKAWIYRDKFRERADIEYLTIGSGVTDAITKKVIEQYEFLLSGLKPLLEDFIKKKLPIENYKTFNEIAGTFIKMVESLKDNGKQSGNTTNYIISYTPRPGRSEEQNIIEISPNGQAEISASSD